uniref:Transposase n=1 Tax=Globodera rostochiensis TaxID=31243 RepID=A0A914HKQ3_GLORO
MGKFWILFLVLFFSTNLLDKAGAVKLELKTFDEIFGEGWWDKGEAEDLKTPPPTNFGQNVHHQIDRQNTQIGQIEHNSTDQNPSLTESDHSDNAKNGEEENEIIKEISSNEKHKIVTKELGLSVRTIYNWKRELGQTTPHHKHSHSEQKELMKRFYEIKGKNPKMRNVDIAKTLKIANETLRRWKKKFERQQITAPNFVDEAPQMFRKLKRRIRRAFE